MPHEKILSLFSARTGLELYVKDSIGLGDVSKIWKNIEIWNEKMVFAQKMESKICFNTKTIGLEHLTQVAYSGLERFLRFEFYIKENNRV